MSLTIKGKITINTGSENNSNSGPENKLRKLSDSFKAKLSKKENITDNDIFDDTSKNKSSIEIERLKRKENDEKNQSKLNIVVQPTSEEQVTLKRSFVIEKNKLKGVASAESRLVVNGKERKIGRKSNYLLDMLTLDDE